MSTLKGAAGTMIFGGGFRREDSTVIVDGSTTMPTLGRYEIIAELGKGAMGVVYKGRDPKIHRLVAIKTIRFDQEFEESQVQEMKDRFFREAETAGKLSHPNIVTIYDVGEDYDLSYLAMEFLEGDDLTKWCKPDNLFPLRRTLEIAAKVSDALGYAHTNGIVHRDIKPANIMLLKNGEVKVTDFGIARMTSSSRTKTGVIMGTPSYMSPEQIAGKRVDGRSDLFSLAVVFYELLAGERPFQGEDLTTIMYQITNLEPRSPKAINPKVPEVCARILEKALHKDPDKRFQTGKEFATYLKAVISKLDEAAAKKAGEMTTRVQRPVGSDG
ncbi:MAG: serine/threonine protein kinase [Candidatus Tectomicrobia bacterium]|nr:serine/threonine protein kinase [Candidatus Tectomicrobia bacterium]